MVRIEALTTHPVQVDLQPSGRALFEPTAHPTRIDQPALSERDLATAAGIVREVLLHRGRRVSGLPPRRRGTVYLVSRTTAQSARRRDDLLFPVRERRDPSGATVVASALGRFQAPRWRRALRWLRTPRLRRRNLTRADWPIGVGLATATAFLAAALSAVPDAVTGDWTAPQTPRRLVVTAILLAVGGATLGWTVLRWRQRSRWLRNRGTAYLLKEEPTYWAHEERESFLAKLRREFARTIWVPGPDVLGEPWGWPLDESATGWGRKVDELVRAFRVARHNDDQTTPNSVFIWAPWPVALAFGARAAAGRVAGGRRGLTLEVRQRPQFGRLGGLKARRWSREPHLFLRGTPGPTLAEALPGARVSEHSRLASLLVTEVADTWSEEEPLDEHGRTALVLLVRLSAQKWGPLPPIEPDQAVEPVTLQFDDAAGLGLAEYGRAQLVEFRCAMPGDAPIPWAAYPALVSSVAEWICRSVAGNRAAEVVLLGMVGPTEVALGLGIHAAQAAVAAAAAGSGHWPEHLWPLVYRGVPGKPAFVVPGLDLGTAALR
ncbi:MAG: hypothetical protein HYR62_05775 [Actinobacteria bacterium]|nr:hypothetical protein [Actinomycetota bacterium]MBI3688549.1 hypothetical protein [Actinomycetota bacterium]